MNKRLSAGLALIAGVALAVGPSGLAFADDAEPVAPIVEVIEAVEADAPEAPAAEVEAPEPVVLAARGPAKPKPTPSKLAVCHSTDGKSWTFNLIDAKGHNGHKDHRHDVYDLSEADCLAKNMPQAPEIVEEWHTWLLSEVYVTPPADGTDVAWPQTYLGKGQIVPTECNLWVQQDRYVGTRAQIDAVLEDRLLTKEPGGYEDRHIVKEWGFKYSGECNDPEPEPEPVICTLDGEWGSESEDVAPVLTIDGLRFSGGTGKATGIGHAINGDFSTFTGADVTATGDTSQLYYRLVIDSSANGGFSYQSLTVTDGLSVTPSSLAYSRQAEETKSIAEWQSLYPDAVMTFEFIHLDSAAAEGVTAYVTAFASDCGEKAWGVVKPGDLAGTEPTILEPVCTEALNGEATVETWGRDWTQAFVPNEDRTDYVLGEKVFGEPYLIGAVLVEQEDCVPTEEPPVEEPPVEEPPVEEPPVSKPPVVNTSNTLPNLGAEDVALWFIIAGVGIAAGITFVAAERKRRNQ